MASDYASLVSKVWNYAHVLRDLGLLAMKGGGNRTYYAAGPAFQPLELWGTSPDTPQARANTHQVAANTPQVDTQILHRRGRR